MDKLDRMIDNAGLRKLIRPAVKRNKAGKTGDTNNMKQFPGGQLILGNANNHKIIRQLDMQYGIIDDFEAVKKSSKESGDTKKLFEQRFAAYADKMKLFFISTPELKQTSNIEPAYLQGDQRKFFIPCPCCGESIDLHWSIKIDEEGKEMAGITWKQDEKGRLISDSVGYICQKCGGFFDDKNKHDLLNQGFWRPTAEPSRMGHYSYHLSSLYAPPGMYDWEHYVQNYIEAHPEGGRNEDLYKSFCNLCLGECYEAQSEAPQANQLQKNIRGYQIGALPEKLSERDGNGKIVLVTCAADLNGKEDDARLDYEVVAWSESGASYSVSHGSIGTFIPREGKNKSDRKHWTYEPHRPNSVWPEFDKVLGQVFQTDTGRKMRIFITGIDSGHYTNHAYSYIDSSNFYVVGLKGDKENRYVRLGLDVPSFKPARERAGLYILQVGMIKDNLSTYMKLKWDPEHDESQPPNFMNYPQPADGLYLFKDYFEHYESEHRTLKKHDNGTIEMMWSKKQSNSQNHFWDVRVYNIAVKEILTAIVCKELKIKDFTWSDYVAAVLGGYK